MKNTKLMTRAESRQQAGYNFARTISMAGDPERLVLIEALATDTPDQTSFDKGIIKFCSELRGTK